MLLTLLVPELLVGKAVSDYLTAKRNTTELQKRAGKEPRMEHDAHLFFRHGTVRPPIPATTKGIEKISK